MLQFVTFWDLILTPIYVLLFYAIIKHIQKKYYKDDPFLSKKLIQGFWIKVIAAILYVFLIQYYYKGGDSFMYFGYSKIMHEAIAKDWGNISLLLATKAEAFYTYAENTDISKYELVLGYMNGIENQYVIKLSCIFGFLCLENYTVTSIMFSLLSFIGIWKMYVLFDKIFRQYRKEVAFSFIFLPSFAFWGSGILKESICIFALGILSYHFFSFLYFKSISLKTIFKLVAVSYILLVVKGYIFYAFVGAIFITSLQFFFKKLNTLSKIILTTLFILLLTISSNLIIKALVGEAASATTEKLIEQSNALQFSYESVGGAFVGAIELDPSPLGIIKNIPQILVTIFFRPFVWEVRNIVMVFSALESLFFLLLFLKLLSKSRFIFIMKYINKHPIFIFSFVFSILMAIIIGFTTFNFGTIIRYKIPFMPFFCMTLLIINKYSLNLKKHIV